MTPLAPDRRPQGLGAVRSLQPGRALRLVWEAAPGWTLVNAALQVVEGALPLAALYLIKLIIDAVEAALVAGPAADPTGRWPEILGLIVVAGVVALTGNLARHFRALATEAQAQEVTDHVFARLHAKSVEVDLAYYEDPRYYDTLHRAQRDAPSRPERIVNGLGELGRSGVGLVGMAALLVVFHWGAALILFLAAVPGVVLRVRHSARTYRWARDRTPLEREAWYYHWMLTMDTYAKEVRLFGFGELIQKRFVDLRRLLRGERLELARHRAWSELGAQVVSTAATYATYGFVAYRAIQGAITLGDLVMYYQAFQRGLGFLRAILTSVASFYEDSLFLSDLYDFLDLEAQVKNPPRPRRTPPLTDGGLRLDGVGFGYPLAETAVLERIDLEIGAGETVALVGRNGSGKSTLVKLLCRLYDPTQGAITWGGADLRELDIAELRSRIAVLTQDFAKYQLTARENIWLGDLARDPRSREVVGAGERADIDAKLRSLPAGYETRLGRWFETGVELSQGEWQKVALARAFLRDAQLLVLDEPTSALDLEAEKRVLASFRELTAGRAAVAVGHRSPVVRQVDRIVVLDRGRIAESGTHSDLLARGGLYAELFESGSRTR